MIVLLTFVQGVIKEAHPDPPPSVSVVVPQPDPAEIDRRVDDRLREIEQQRHAEHPGPTAAPEPGREPDR